MKNPPKSLLSEIEKEFNKINNITFEESVKGVKFKAKITWVEGPEYTLMKITPMNKTAWPFWFAEMYKNGCLNIHDVFLRHSKKMKSYNKLIKTFYNKVLKIESKYHLFFYCDGFSASFRNK